MTATLAAQTLALPLLACGFLAWLTEGMRLFALLLRAATQVSPFPLWVLRHSRVTQHPSLRDRLQKRLVADFDLDCG